MHYLFFIFIALLSQGLYAHQTPEQINLIVYTSNNYPIHHKELADKIYFLDAVELLEDKLSTQLDLDPTIAEAQAKQFMLSNEFKQIEREIIRAYEGITEGWRMGVMKIPAIVFQPQQTPYQNAKIIYGENDVSKAIGIYNQYKR